MRNTLTIPVTVRVRNHRAVLACMYVLGVLSRWMRPGTTVRLGNAVLQWLMVETRIGRGEWKQMEHGIKLTCA